MIKEPWPIGASRGSNPLILSLSKDDGGLGVSPSTPLGGRVGGPTSSERAIMHALCAPLRTRVAARGSSERETPSDGGLRVSPSTSLGGRVGEPRMLFLSQSFASGERHRK